MVILYDQYNLPEDVYDIIFSTTQQVIVAKMLLDEMKKHGGELGKTEMSLFATALHDGQLKEPEQQSTMLPKKKTPAFKLQQKAIL